MFRVILVDDESAAVEYIQGIIETRCSGFEVVGTAKSGETCLEILEHTRADVIVTDIRMAGIDGLALIEKIRKADAHIQLIIVSGYSEFEYAKKAITNQVFEYILKPVDPEEFALIMKRLAKTLESMLIVEKKQLFKTICQGLYVESEKIIKYFGDEEYYAFLVRRNNLPRHFLNNKNAEVVSNIYGSFFLYARGEDEAFYLIPKSCLNSKEELIQIIEKCCENYRQEQGFISVVKVTKSFDAAAMVKIIEGVYGMLKRYLVCGVDQKMNYRGQQEPVGIHTDQKVRMQKILFFMGKKQTAKAKMGLRELFMDFKNRRVAQIFVENVVRQMCSSSWLEEEYRDYNSDREYLLDEILFHSLSMDELYQNLSSFLFKEEKMKLRSWIPQNTLKQFAVLLKVIWLNRYR